MSINCNGIKHSFIIAVLILGACSYTATPRFVPLVKDNQGDSFKGISVLITNGEKEVSDSPVLTDSRQNSALKANRRAWAQKLVESLAGELARRGADVRSTAAVTVTVTIPEIVFAESRELYQFQTRAALAGSSGWKKEYQGTAGAEPSRVFSLSQEVDRLSGQTLVEIIKQVLSDSDFASELRAKK